ncbi:MAG: single-stranded DNA-binding protein [Thaumarchaeota archaeon]|nr:single-stranded DNA-binding protein [Nitrososphaerota archaeon]MDE1866204.1 single-stranded DNA-binding protein [Nitrososphaerota archaeon]
MSEFDSLMNKLLEQKPELSRKDMEEMIQRKKEKIGAGYLTDQGALFLIASDLGVSLSEPLKVEMGLKDIYVGAKEITLESRVMNVYPVRQFSRKDGSQFLLRNMTVYDGDSRAKVKLWDEKANLPGIENLKPGDLVKIIKAYVKSDMKGNPIINVGSGSTVEPNNMQSKIPGLDAITDNVSSVKENQQNLVVTGILDGNIRTTEFTNFKGEPSKALQLRLKGSDGTIVRAVLWNKDENSVPKVVSSGAKARLIGVNTKVGQMGLELHGDEGTVLEIEGAKEIEPIVTRILSATKSDSRSRLLVGVLHDKKLVNIIDTSSITSDLKPGDVIEITPSKVYGNSLTIEQDSPLKKIDGQDIPTLSDTRTKIRDVKPSDGTYCIEAIILKAPQKKEIQTKTGETVLLSETFVEDDTGQIWLKGWRLQSRLLEQFTQGEIISVTGVTAKPGLEGRTEIFLTAYSVVTRKN